MRNAYAHAHAHSHNHYSFASAFMLQYLMHEIFDFTFVPVVRRKSLEGCCICTLFHCMYPKLRNSIKLFHSLYHIWMSRSKSRSSSSSNISECRWMSVMCKCDFYHLIHSSFMLHFTNFQLNALLLVSPFWCVLKKKTNAGGYALCICVCFMHCRASLSSLLFFLLLLFSLPLLLPLTDNSFSPNFHTNNI